MTQIERSLDDIFVENVQGFTAGMSVHPAPLTSSICRAER